MDNSAQSLHRQAIRWTEVSSLLHLFMYFDLHYTFYINNWRNRRLLTYLNSSFSLHGSRPKNNILQSSNLQQFLLKLRYFSCKFKFFLFELILIDLPQFFLLKPMPFILLISFLMEIFHHPINLLSVFLCKLSRIIDLPIEHMILGWKLAILMLQFIQDLLRYLKTLFSLISTLSNMLQLKL